MADVDVPKLGKVNKKVVIGVAVAAGAFIAYRYYQSRNAIEDTSTDPGYEDPGMLPGVEGAIKPDGRYGSGDTTQTSDTTQFTTNAQWSQFALEKLSQSDTWTYTQIAEALGNYLNDRALSDLQKSIVTAALGVAGHEPVGSHSIISGGNVDVTVAPTGVTASSVSATGAVISFVAVPGARTYNAYRSDSPAAAGTSGSSPITLSGLAPGTAYTVSVAAVSSAGAVGPKSSPITVKTPAVAVAKPSKPVVSSNPGGGRVTLTTSKVPNATSYRWFSGSTMLNATDGPIVTLTRLKLKTRYAVAVQADTSAGKPGQLSAATTFTTK